MRVNIILLFSLLVALGGCSTESEKAPEEELLVPGGLDISYQTDDARTASATITPESGGTVQATSADGVSFALAVDPGAVGSAIAVSVTPFSYLSIEETETQSYATASSGLLTVGAGSVSRDVRVPQPTDTVCVHGALFEPDGLTFDSTAVLTITFPQQGFDCDMDEVCIVGVDSTESWYEILPTTFYVGANALVCTLTHFSGYGTHSPEYDLLESLIRTALEDGGPSSADALIELLSGYMEWATSRGWDDLASKALAGAEAEVRGMAADGRGKCNAKYRPEGRALLLRALAYAQRGFVQDPTFKQQIKDWLTDCGAIQIEMTADKGVIYDLAWSENDDRTYVTFEARVTDMDGNPVESVQPNLWWTLPSTKERTLASASARTGYEPGVTRLRYVYQATPASHIPEGVATFQAVVQEAGETILSNPVDVTLRRVRITVDCVFDYLVTLNYVDGGGASTAAMYSANGSKTTQGGCAGTFVARSYSSVGTRPSSNESWTCLVVDDPQLPVCNMFWVDYRFGLSNDEFQSSLTILDKASVSISSPFSYVERHCEQTQDGVTTVTDVWVDMWNGFYSTSDIERDYGYLYWNGVEFTPYLFEGGGPIRDGDWSASLRVTVGVE